MNNLKDVNNTFPNVVKESKCVSRKCFVVLDTESSSSKTCVMSYNSGPSSIDFVNFCCDVSSVLSVLEAMQSDEQAANHFCNAAAMTGSVFKSDLYQEMEKSSAPIRLSDYPRHENWNTQCQLRLDSQTPSTPWHAVYCTTEVPLEVSQSHSRDHLESLCNE